jgi:hypothetical protein
VSAAKLYQPPTTPLTVQYAPDAETVILENPPRFTWMPARLEDERYLLQIARSSDFRDALSVQPLPYNFHTPDRALPPGQWFWRYALLTGEDRSEWSAVRSFTIPEHLPETPLPARDQRWNAVNLEHPRLWLQPEQIAAFRECLKHDPTYCAWDMFYEKSVLPWRDRTLIPEPAPYPNGKRTAPLWRKMYIDCQEALYAVQHLSIAGVILQDEALINAAKRWLLHLASWDTEGVTSRDYNDEAAFRIVGALAWGYDWLHDLLDQHECETVRRALFRRTQQVAEHVINHSKIHHVPYDSHAVRSLSSVLVPCCIALLDDFPEAREWLDYTLEYYACLYSPWGGIDGGWAEGPMYWTTGMAFVTEALNLIRNYTELDFYQRPFFQKTGDFPLYCYPPDSWRTSFGDQSNMGERPILKTAYNIRQFAAVTGNPAYQWYFEQVRAYDTDPDSKFYNWGWWDFRFDDVMYLHDYPQVKAAPPEPASTLKHFRDIGWVALHENIAAPDDHLYLLFKSSQYGSVSHSHGDQNAFMLHAYGEPLAVETGYYIAFGSSFHREWRRQTRSKNALLIDGIGQYAGNDKQLCIEARGEIVQAESHADYQIIRGDATAAYAHNVPYAKRVQREIYFVRGAYFVIVDTVELAQPGRVNWLLHTLHPMQLGDQSFRVVGQKADLNARFVYCSSGAVTMAQTDVFDQVDPAEYADLQRHWHLTATTPPAPTHRLVTLLEPRRKDDPRYVSHFMDDQGHGVMLYFIADGHTQRIALT